MLYARAVCLYRSSFRFGSLSVSPINVSIMHEFAKSIVNIKASKLSLKKHIVSILCTYSIKIKKAIRNNNNNNNKKHL